MTKRIKTTFGAVAALAALALGGSAIAGAASNQPSKPPAQSSTVQPQSSKAPSQSKGAESNAPENSGTDPDNVQDTTTPDAPGTSGETSSESAGESAPNSDGPGGHADEPVNPNANNQAQGVQ